MNLANLHVPAINWKALICPREDGTLKVNYRINTLLLKVLNECRRPITNGTVSDHEHIGGTRLKNS